MKRWWLVLALLAVAATGCDSGGNGGTDLGGDALADVANDLVFPDACACRSQAECTGKVTPGTCQIVACESCACVLKNRPAGAQCDDGDAATLHDTCNDKGTCIGKPASCGDGSCEGEENCENCPKDCGCKDASLWCWEKKCQARPVDGNGKCEPGENCQDNAKDCPCKTGTTACSDRQCKTCADFCKESAQDCGKPQGCACGTCQEGWLCSELNQCYNPAQCNDGRCDPGETCASCPSDCGCPNGQACHTAKCVSCAEFCAANGKDCGFFGGCDCGPETLCHTCTANKLVPDCKCIRYPESKKQCGEIEGCLLGPLEGNCPEGKECVGHLCLENCDSLCAGLECGWGQDCICDWCWGSDVCKANKCEAGIETPDSYEPNENWDTASDLGSTNDNDTESARDIVATIHDPYDFDWYKIKVDDKFGESLVLNVTLEGFGEDKDLDLAVCYQCDSGALPGAGLTPADSVFEVTPSLITIGDTPVRCFASANLWGYKEEINLDPTCEGGQNDSATVYFFILGAEEYDYGPEYHLKFHF